MILETVKRGFSDAGVNTDIFYPQHGADADPKIRRRNVNQISFTHKLVKIAS